MIEPLPTRTICLHGGWSAVRRRIPIEKLFDLRDEIVLVIDQVIDPPSLWHISSYHLGSLAYPIHVTTSTLHGLFVSCQRFSPLKNMILTPPNSSERARCYRFSQRNFLSKEQRGEICVRRRNWRFYSFVCNELTEEGYRVLLLCFEKAGDGFGKLLCVGNKT